MSAPRPLYNLDAARQVEQRRFMEELEADDVCIFCPEHVERYQREPIERTGEHWYVRKNDYPYEGSLAHYLIVARAHVLAFEELPDEAGAELWQLKRELRACHQAVAFATVERSGNMLYNGGSVAHLHVHFVALAEEPESTVRFRVSAYARGEEPQPRP
jgi:diadenosine tetraphosphate (Ap4A) HIT family hydrolase